MEMETVLRELISRVNKTLGYYEKDFISVQRTPFSERERVKSFEQYIEARFNFECCSIPELYDAVIATDGHLFSCTELINPDVVKRRFTLAKVTLLDTEILSEDQENLINEINKVRDLLGGTIIKFNNVKKKIKFTVEK